MIIFQFIITSATNNGFKNPVRMDAICTLLVFLDLLSNKNQDMGCNAHVLIS
jgi:hypothetical protein